MIDPFEHHLRLHIAETQAAFDDALRARQLQDTGRAVLLQQPPLFTLEPDLPPLVPSPAHPAVVPLLLLPQ